LCANVESNAAVMMDSLADADVGSADTVMLLKLRIGSEEGSLVRATRPKLRCPGFAHCAHRINAEG
jgi:hypothetical protein